MAQSTKSSAGSHSDKPQRSSLHSQDSRSQSPVIDPEYFGSVGIFIVNCIPFSVVAEYYKAASRLRQIQRQGRAAISFQATDIGCRPSERIPNFRIACRPERHVSLKAAALRSCHEVPVGAFRPSMQPQSSAADAFQAPLQLLPGSFQPLSCLFRP